MRVSCGLVSVSGPCERCVWQGGVDTGGAAEHQGISGAAMSKWRVLVAVPGAYGFCCCTELMAFVTVLSVV